MQVQPAEQANLDSILIPALTALEAGLEPHATPRASLRPMSVDGDPPSEARAPIGLPPAGGSSGPRP